MSAPSSLIGRSYGSYRLVSQIGEGAMGQVYRAVHPDQRKKAAVKVVLPHLCERAQVVGRFFNEAKAATRIQHPGIVEIYDYGRNDDGSAYIAMEFLEGQSLADRLAAGRMPLPLVLELAGQIAGALEAAHGEGIIHRDLKPDNIFLVPDPLLPHGLRCKILDFGVAKLIEGSEVEATRVGMMMGTPRYMAPEQSRGAGSVDRTADVYSLGCIVFEMVAGRPPFLAESANELIAAHVIDDAPSLRELAPDALAATCEAVNKALQKTPGQRFQFAVELAKALGCPPASFAPATRRPVKGPSFHERRAGGMGTPGARGPLPSSARAEGREAAARLFKRLPSVESSRVQAGPPTILIAIAVAILAVAVGLLFVQIGRKGRSPHAPTVSSLPAPLAPPVEVVPPPTPIVSASVPAPVRFTIASKPTGAQVYRVADGVRVGVTPYVTERAPTDGELIYSVQRKGFKDIRVVFPADRGGEADVELHRQHTVRTEPKDTPEPSSDEE